MYDSQNRRCLVIATLLFVSMPLGFGTVAEAREPSTGFDSAPIGSAFPRSLALDDVFYFQPGDEAAGENRLTQISLARRQALGPQLENPPAGIADLPEPIAAASVGQGASASGATESPIERYGEAPVDRSRQFLRSVSPLLRPGQWQFDYGLVYALQEFNFPVLIGANPARADLRSRALFVPLAVRYGWNRRTQLFANLPVGWANTELATPVVDDDSGKGGLGDCTFGITRLLHQNSCNGQTLIGTLRAVAPTGTEASPLVLTGAGLGNGVWRMGGDLLVVRSLDPCVLFYGAGYTYSFQRDFDGVQVELGHEFQYNFGLGFAANERVTLSTAFLGSYITETRFNDQLVPNSDQEPLRIRLAATIAQNCRIVEPFVNFGLTETAPAAELGIVWTR
ncbi:MAG: hypothetical protein P8L85_14085 [Rubripirellula sp.]|nr:hypothetical protein [Rubripirellula sp.]